MEENTEKTAAMEEQSAAEEASVQPIADAEAPAEDTACSASVTDTEDPADETALDEQPVPAEQTEESAPAEEAAAEEPAEAQSAEAETSADEPAPDAQPEEAQPAEAEPAADESAADAQPQEEQPAESEEMSEKEMKKEANRLRKDKLKVWKKDARQKAKEYLKERHRTIGPKHSMVRYEMQQEIRTWKAGLKNYSKEEQRDQKIAYRAFKRRKRRAVVITVWSVVLVLLVALGFIINSGLISFPMLFRVLSTQKYKSTGAAADAVRADGYALSAEICDEGYVLLKNDDGFLPIDTSTRISVFGDDAYQFVYGGSGSAGADQSGSTGIFEALNEFGIAYNTDLDNTYRNELHVGTGSDSGIGSMVTTYLVGADSESDWVMPSDETISAAAQWSDTALIVLSSQEVEGSEVSLALLQPAKDGTNKASLIDKVCNSFEHVIFIINSGNCMELGFLDDYDSIDACLWVGAPGSQGCIEMVRTLIGEVNPSGRTVDTWPVSIENEPSYITYGDYAYINKTELNTMTYSEGIYVGYRYYETWYEGDEDAYWGHVVYPFGYGLSYTTFTETMTGYTADDTTITVNVTVQNTGSVAGKDVVELYFMAPWYRSSNIEKSVIELGAYSKTSMLEPGASETLTLTIPVRSMSSYDEMNACYVLEHGDYRIVLGRNVHDAATSADFKTYTVAQDIRYTTDETTGSEIKSLFNYAAGEHDGVTYMSRADKEGTFPVRAEEYVTSREMLIELGDYNEYSSDYDYYKTEEPTYGAKNKIKLDDLKGLDYDDSKWESFLDQMTLDELIKLQANGGWHTMAISRLGIKGTTMLDGPSGLNSMMSKLTSVAYPMETVIASSWNTDMAAALGTAVGNEANVYGVNFWYAPALNIHRTSIGGRNSEYYSEDPYLAGTMGAATVKAVQEKGVVAVVKHFVCNDTELNARSDISLWVQQQALREIYLTPFEIAVKDGEAHGVMSSFTRLGVKWCGGSGELLNDLLRKEWGFDGLVTTDACLGEWMNAEVAAKNGNDLMLEMGMMHSETTLYLAYQQDPIGVAWSLRDCAHHVLYTICNYVG